MNIRRLKKKKKMAGSPVRKLLKARYEQLQIEMMYPICNVNLIVIFFENRIMLLSLSYLLCFLSWFNKYRTCSIRIHE